MQDSVSWPNKGLPTDPPVPCGGGSDLAEALGKD